MNGAGFRRAALALPEVVEGGHQGNADFRHAGRIFATLHPGEVVGMVVLPPLRQQELLRGGVAGIRPAAGAWGRQGCTLLELAVLDEAAVEDLLTEAWQHLVARLVAQRGKK